jgi:hypothetical protein
MKRSPWLLFLLVAALAASAFYGFYKLLELRFESGDVYPPSSSLRADPLGTEVLYDALAGLHGLSVSRNFQSLDKIPHPDGATIFYTGIASKPLSQDASDYLNALVKNGARLVITMEPETAPTRETAQERNDATGVKKRPKKGSQTKLKKGSETDNDEEQIEFVGFDAFIGGWGAKIAYRKSQNSTDKELTAEAAQPNLERGLTWHTALYFPTPTKQWRVLYNCEGQPAIMERQIGKGSMILAADSYFLSNEAMRKERAPLLLATLIGPNARIVFDESHLGVEEQPGIATLVRKYNLGGLVAALAVLAALFVWQTSSSFLPPLPDQADGDGIVTGKDSTAGFVSLLRRGVAPARLIAVCMEQWKQSFARRPGTWAGVLDRIDSAALNGAREPVATYQAISRILAEQKKTHANHP